jgi:hypothetical protein
MARTDWTLVNDVYRSRDGRVAVFPQRDSDKKVRCWTIEVDGVYVGWQRRLDNAKQYGIESRDGLISGE